MEGDRPPDNLKLVVADELIPEDTLLNIFAHLSAPEDISVVSLVSVVWWLLSQQAVVWNRLDLSFCGYRLTKSNLLALLHKRSHVRELRLLGCKRVFIDRDAGAWPMLVSLQTLDLSHCQVNDNQLPAVLENSPSLTKLNLSYTQAKNRSIAALSQHCHFLRSLSLAKCGMNGGRPQIDEPVLNECLTFFALNLRHLDLVGQKIGPLIAPTLAQMTNLNSLRLEVIPNQENASMLENIFLFCPLEDLEINWDFFSQVSHVVPSLVRFSCGKKISDSSCIALVKRCRKLRTLFLQGDDLTDSSLLEFSNLETLRELSLNKLQHVSELGIDSLTKCTLLERLELLSLFNDKVKSDRMMNQFCANCEYIMHLKLGKTTLTHEGIKLISTFRLLKSLSLDSVIDHPMDSNEDYRKAFIEIGNKCTLLEDLRLRFINCIDDSVLCNFSATCPLLSLVHCEYSCFGPFDPTRLQISETDFFPLTSSFLAELGKNTRNLRSLILSNCDLDNGLGLAPLQFCSKLELVSLSNSRGVQEIHLEEVVKKCRNLKRIELDAKLFNPLSKDMKDWKIENNTMRLIHLSTLTKANSANDYLSQM